MSITDELREFYQRADGYELWCPRHRRELAEIADRIEAELAERYMELPVDADGVPIKVGDVMVTEHSSGKTTSPWTVWYITAFEGRTEVHDTNGAWRCHGDGHHYHEPTVEDVLRAMLDALDVDVCADPDATIAEYAAKLRLAGEGE